MTELVERVGDELEPGVVSHATSLEITRELRFNEWRRIGEQLSGVNERAAWALGDWRVYGDRFETEYADGLAQVDRTDRSIRQHAQVARVFAPHERSETLSWWHHYVLATSVRDHGERLSWLSAAERGGWSGRELEDRLKGGRQALSGRRPPALQLRPVGDVVERFERRAAAMGRPVRELALEVLELASQLDDPVAALEAAGARRELEAA